MKIKIKNFFYKNYIFILLLVISLIISGVYANNFKNTYIDNTTFKENLKNICSIEENKQNPLCINYNSNINNNYDILTVFYNFITESPFQYISVFGIVIVSLLVFKKLIFDESAKYFLTRENYNNYNKRILKKAFSIIWLLPCIFLILFLFACIISRTFNYEFAAQSGISTFDLTYLKMGWKFFIIFEINITLFSCIYVCYALISYKITHNKYIAIVLSFIFLIISEILFNEFVPAILNLFKVDTHMYLTLINVLNFYDIPNYKIYLLIKLLAFVSLFIVVKFMYRKKEKYVYNIERMEENRK